MLMRCIAAGLVFSTAAAAAPTVDELVDKAVKAMGGKAIEKIESYVATSETTAPGGAMTSEVVWAKPSHVLVKQIMPQGGEIEMGTNGKIGWTRNPMMGGYQLMEGEDLDQITQKAMHMRVLRLRETMQEDFEDIKSTGKAEFGGQPCYELRMKSRQDGKQTAMYFDAGTGLIRGMEVMQDEPSGPQTMIIKLKDWKPIGEVSFFHLVEMAGGQMDVSMRYTRIEVNTVDRAKLAVPREVAELAMKRAGRPDDAEMSLEDFSPQVQSVITSMLDGLPWDNAPALREVRATLEPQAARMPGEYKDGMKYVIRKIDQRLRELEGTG
jgi:outer membrane lipoprotein-sorting protein